MLRASANNTAQTLIARSSTRDSRSLTWVNFAAKSVRAATSSNISGKVNSSQPARDFFAKAHKTLRFVQFVQCSECKLVLPLNGFYPRKLV